MDFCRTCSVAARKGDPLGGVCFLADMKTLWKRARRARLNEGAGAPSGTEPNVATGAVTTPDASSQGPLRMALIVATSALLGGITVALWNRRILETMRRPVAPLPPDERASQIESEEFI